jgi:hypothetical protein
VAHGLRPARLEKIDENCARAGPLRCFLEVLILNDFKSLFPEVLIPGDFKSFAPEVLILVELKSLVMNEMREIERFLEVLNVGGLVGMAF